MSVALNRKSGEFEDDSVNLMATDYRSKCGWRSQISVWWIGAAAVWFLLLILILGVVAHNSGAISQRSSKCEELIHSLTTDRDAVRDERDQLKISSCNMTILLNAMAASRDKLQKEKDALRDERDELKFVSLNLTQQLETLKSRFNAVAARQDDLQKEVNNVSLNGTRLPCRSGWTPFGGKCYYLSGVGSSKTWQNSRRDCQDRGGDLAIVTTKEELNFVGRAAGITWIGLSDLGEENNWKWVDGTDMVDTQFWEPGEPNNSHGNEDCAEVATPKNKFNDAPCARTFSWACEY